MTTRRKLFAALATLPFIGKVFATQKLPESSEILMSFDARDWARHFISHVKANPSIPLDEGTMQSWFANALMRGYDESTMVLNYKLPDVVYTTKECIHFKISNFGAEADIAAGKFLSFLSETGIRGAVARGWCSEKNRYKEMDFDLAEAIVQSLMECRDEIRVLEFEAFTEGGDLIGKGRMFSKKEL